MVTPAPARPDPVTALLDLCERAAGLLAETEGLQSGSWVHAAVQWAGDWADTWTILLDRPDPAQTRPLRPDTGNNRSLPCTQCGIRTPDAMFTDCCGSPMCDNCRPGHGWCEPEQEHVQIDSPIEAKGTIVTQPVNPAPAPLDPADAVYRWAAEVVTSCMVRFPDADALIVEAQKLVDWRLGQGRIRYATPKPTLIAPVGAGLVDATGVVDAYLAGWVSRCCRGPDPRPRAAVAEPASHGDQPKPPTGSGRPDSDKP
jgi:hypothetical protein